jgi:hypothetical protein
MDNETLGGLVNHHEAGHTLGCIIYEIEFSGVEAERGFFGGYTGNGVTRLVGESEGGMEEWARRELDGVLVMGAMGAAAERHWMLVARDTPGWVSEGAGGDREITATLIRQYRQRTSWDVLLERAYHQVVLNWPRLAGIAAALEAKKKLSAAQAARAKELQESAP